LNGRSREVLGFPFKVFALPPQTSSLRRAVRTFNRVLGREESSMSYKRPASPNVAPSLLARRPRLAVLRDDFVKSTREQGQAVTPSRMEDVNGSASSLLETQRLRFDGEWRCAETLASKHVALCL